MLKPIEPPKVATIEREHRATVRVRKGKHVWVADGLARVASIARGQNIVPKMSQCFDRAFREILVGVKLSHAYASSFAAICSSISDRCAAT